MAWFDILPLDYAAVPQYVVSHEYYLQKKAGQELTLSNGKAKHQGQLVCTCRRYSR